MIKQNTSGFLSTTIEYKIATIVFEHPASNSLPSSLLQRLINEIIHLGQHPEVAIIVLKSKGTTTFCAGAYFDELVTITDEIQGKAFFSNFANLINAMRKCPKIIVGRVHGKVVGGGVGIVAACDYVLASQEASIKLSELTIGIGPFVIAPVVAKKIGKTALSELSLEATQWKTASWAKEKGLYAHIFESIDALDKGIKDFVITLSNFNPMALVELKKLFWEETAHWDTLLIERAEITGKLVLSDFTKNALRTFQNKKK